MKEGEVDSVLDVIMGMFELGAKGRAELRRRLLILDLGASAKGLKHSWIGHARVVAQTIAQNNGSVTIEDVLAELPLPDELDPRIVGGVFKHPMFKRTGNRTIQARDGRYKTVGMFSLAQTHEPITDWD
jgi:hypothetical protein